MSKDFRDNRVTKMTIGTLGKYRSMKVVISAPDAHKILSHYFGATIPGVHLLDENDCRFAQAMIVEAAEASARIGVLESLWKTASSPQVKPLGVLRSVARAVLRYLGRPKTVQDAVDSSKYEMVLNAIAYNCSGAWRSRINTGDTTLLL